MKDSLLQKRFPKQPTGQTQQPDEPYKKGRYLTSVITKSQPSQPPRSNDNDKG